MPCALRYGGRTYWSLWTEHRNSGCAPADGSFFPQPHQKGPGYSFRLTSATFRQGVYAFRSRPFSSCSQFSYVLVPHAGAQMLNVPHSTTEAKLLKPNDLPGIRGQRPLADR